MSSLGSFFSDVRFALRLLVRAPLFSLTLLGVLIAGIGATTAMFSITESMLLRPLPFDRPEELTMLWRTEEPLAREWPLSYPNFKDWETENKTFQAMAAVGARPFSMSMPGKRAVYVNGADVTGDFFRMFSIRPLYGRLLDANDDRAEASPVCVLSAEVWRRELGGDPAVVGRTIMLNSMPFTVIGIAPEGFRWESPRETADAWVSLVQDFAGRSSELRRGNNFLRVMGRRKTGVSLDAAQADLTNIARSLETRYPDSNAHTGANLVDLHDVVVDGTKESVLILFGAVALLFLVVCANVASLLLARGATRRGEMAARAALGATRARLAAQLVTESVVLFLIGGAGGAVAARFLVDFFVDTMQLHAENTAHAHVDARALVFAVTTALVCGIAFGLAPALATSRIEPYAVLKESAAQAGVNKTQRAVRGGLVVAQVAVAFALLVASGIALRAVERTAEIPPGFDPNGVTTARVVLPGVTYDTDAKQIEFFDRLLKKLETLPGAQSAGLNTSLPMAGWNSNGWFKIEGRAAWPPHEGPLLERNAISTGYFETMRIPVLRGRDFNETDRADGRPVMILSQEAAAKFFPGEDAIGHRIDLQNSEDAGWREIVGVAGDVRRDSLTRPPVAEAYIPFAQAADRWLTIAVRSSRPEAMLDEIRTTVTELDPEIAAHDRQLLTARVAETVSQQRVLAILLGAFAIAGLLLSTLGLFGLVSYSTSQRTRELGLRMALGSSPGAVVALVVRGGAKLVGLGLAIGLVGAVLLGRTVAAHVTGASGFDPLVFGTIPLVLGVAGLVSCALPAWRAARIPPSSALRYE